MFRKRKKIHRLGFYCYKWNAREPTVWLAAQSHYEFEMRAKRSTRIFHKGTRRVARDVDQLGDRRTLPTGGNDILVQTAPWRVHNHHNLFVF